VIYIKIYIEGIKLDSKMKTEDIVLIVILVIFALLFATIITVRRIMATKYTQKKPPPKTYKGTSEKHIIIDNLKECIDDKSELIKDIIDKQLEPLIHVHEITKQLPYTPTCSYFTTLHVGQLKLFISELHFCTLANNSHKDPFTFVYAGSAPNNKGFILNKMFPNMTGFLVDPAEHLLYMPNCKTQYDTPNKILYFCCSNTNRFNIKHRIVDIFDGDVIKTLNRDSIEVKEISDKWRSGGTIDKSYLEIVKKVINKETSYNNIIIEDYFKDETAEFCKNIPNLLFASDIRTNAYDMLNIKTMGKKDITDLDICVNSAMMLAWINVMKPRLSMLKFRPPYYMYKERAIFDQYCNTGIYKHYFDKVKHQIDFVADYQKKKFNYILGEEAIQAYAGTTSGETRLIFGDVKIGLYDHLKREANLFYYNQIRRQYGFHNTLTDSISGIDNCGDCALAQKIFKNYTDKYSIIDPEFSINGVMTLLRRSLNITNHGKFLSVNKTITDVYKQQGNVLLEIYLKNKRIKLIPIDIDLEARYKNIIARQGYAALAKQYNIKFPHILERFKSYYHTWENKQTAREYCYYVLISKHGLTKSNANTLLATLVNQSSNNDDISELQVTEKSTYYEIKYKDFSCDIHSTKFMTADSANIYVNALMYDTRPDITSFTHYSVLFNILKMIISDHKYSNICEFSLGLHDIILGDKFKNTKHYTYIDCGKLSNPISDFKIQPKTIIFGFQHMYPLNYLKTIISQDSLLIFVTLDTQDSKYQSDGYLIQFPFKPVNYMNEPIDYYATHISFYFIGPPSILYKIKKYYENIDVSQKQ